MPAPQQSHTWIIDHYLQDGLDGNELRFQERPLRAMGEGDILVSTRLLSLDASNLLWLSEKEDYLPQLQLGEPMRGNIIARIEASNHPDFEIGNHILTLQTWSDYHVLNGDALLQDGITLQLKPHPDIPLDAYVGTLGITGWSAYIGMMEVGQLKAGERVLVSGAAGATGIMAAQIAKAAGAEVYGLAGGASKCALLTEKLGLNGAIDYKAERDLSAAIKRLIPDGVQVFFDNVGGEILDAALPAMTNHGRIVASGSVSQYGHANAYGVKNLPLITSKRLKMEGFLILDHLADISRILTTMEAWLLEGRLTNQIQGVSGLENAQTALMTLATGGNTGKLAVYCD